MADREEIDHYFGSPYFEGSKHPDAVPPATAGSFCTACGFVTPSDPESRVDICDVCGTPRRGEEEEEWL